uniref:3'-5' exoribonuclease Rv2179c-like domain-containing protein n=1 Tax=viral metagenome TaxID=1070528 RepID=A0A6C0LWW7_9ZZZZ
MSNVMLDLETLSTDSNSVILTIGAVRFNREYKVPELSKCDTFYRRIKLGSCEEVGLQTSKDTQEWWDSQSKSARHEVFINKDRVGIHQALCEFVEWFGRSSYIWAHGDDFDCVVLNSAYKACDILPPWKFWNTRDTRTIYDIAKVHINDVPVEIAHHALHDAYRQVVLLQNSFKILKLK